MTQFRRVLLAVVAAALAVGCASAASAQAAPPQARAAAPATTGTTLNVYVTFYGAADNDPPGSAAIAFPRLHRSASGVGTWADPITFATAYHRTYPAGTRIYVPRLQKYFVMEDDCACSQPRDHVDLWAGGVGNDQGVIRCEDRLTLDGFEKVVKNPDRYRAVNTRPLYSRATGCLVR
jgi:hypothetical protein